MNESAAPANPYAVRLDALVDEVRVARADQHEEQEATGSPSSDWAWDERRRQSQLAGGA